MSQSDKQTIQDKLESFFPDSRQRQTVLKAFANSVQRAMKIADGEWVVRERDNDLILNVKNLVIFKVQKGRLYLALDEKSLQAQHIDPQTAFPNWENNEEGKYSNYQNPRSVNGFYYLTAEADDWAQIQQLHFHYIDNIGGTRNKIRPESERAHDPSIIAFLNENIPDIRLPMRYPGIPSDKSEELQEVVHAYTTYIQQGGLAGETYKFDLIQQNWGLPDLEADDFAASVKQINFHNLLDWRAAGAMKEELEADPEGYREILKNLFNEAIPLEERLNAFKTDVNELVEKAGLSFGNPGNDGRTASVLLTFKYPEKYCLYKHQFYSHFCKFLDINPEKHTYKYPHYLQLANQVLENYLLPKQELMDRVKAYLGYQSLGPAQQGLIAQDFLYQSFDKSKTPANFSETIGVENNYDQTKTTLPQNVILHGPPGTGKTYRTISKAVEILAPEAVSTHDRTSLKQTFERLEKEGRVDFVTFHQSMTYEDFIEGIKPQTSDGEDDGISYKVEDGIFKQMAVNAGFALVKANQPASATQTLDFSEAYDRLAQEAENAISEGQSYTIQTRSGKDALVDHITSQGNIAFDNPNSDRYYVVSKERLAKIHQAFEDISAIDNITDAFRSVIGGHHTTFYWAVLNELRNGYIANEQQRIDWDAFGYEDRKQAVQQLNQQSLNNRNTEPHLLIIDEINRGNIAEILGELITLLEPDKRLGETEALTVRLPYSRESFAVPPNLYIIGTMNTADRSVEALDTALRRRFAFKAFNPEPDLIPEINDNGGMVEVGDQNFDLSEILSTINGRIERLMDQDHCIGHSYFLDVNDENNLKQTFQNQIIPLLQEYFFEDFGKIGLILGPGFVEKAHNQNITDFPNFEHEAKDMLDDQPVYRITDLDQLSNEAFQDALNQLLNRFNNESEA